VHLAQKHGVIATVRGSAYNLLQQFFRVGRAAHRREVLRQARGAFHRTGADVKALVVSVHRFRKPPVQARCVSEQEPQVRIIRSSFHRSPRKIERLGLVALLQRKFGSARDTRVHDVGAKTQPLSLILLLSGRLFLLSLCLRALRRRVGAQLERLRLLRVHQGHRRGERKNTSKLQKFQSVFQEGTPEGGLSTVCLILNSPAVLASGSVPAESIRGIRHICSKSNR
jgi:hypothetical protein